MTFGITDLEPRIGSLVETDIETLLSGRHAAEIRELLERRGVLVFRGLKMSDEQQLDFTRTFGEVFNPKSTQVYKVTFDKQENPLYELNYGNFSWHIDRTDTELPPFASILSARRLTERGGETEFANTYAAYDDLPGDEKARIEGLRVVHRVAASMRERVPNPTDAQRALWAQFDDTEHPLVWRHRSGRKSLITSTSGLRVVGMAEAEGAALLARLLAWATQPHYVYVHSWRIDDVLMWDNTGVMHRVRDYDLDAGRLLHRTTIAGVEPFDAARHREAA